MSSDGTLNHTVQSSKKSATLFNELDSTTQDEGITLIAGAPGPRCLKRACEILQNATPLLMQAPDAQGGDIMQYGPRLGAPFFRQELAKFLTHNYGDTVDSENLILNAGATSGLLLASSVFFKAGCTVFVEDPSYFIAFKIFREDLGYKVVAVPSDEIGLKMAALDEALTKERKNAVQKDVTDDMPFWSMVYLVPTYNNPTGRCMPPDRSKELIRLARKHDVMLFCDDVYNLLHYGPQPHAPPRLLSYDKVTDPDYKGHVISNGSFTKIFAPGLRVGWMEASDRIVKRMWKSAVMWSGGAVNHYTSQLVAMAMQKGWQQELLEELIVLYKSRVQAVCKILKEHLPSGCEFYEPEGGYFIWVMLPKDVDTKHIELVMREKHNIKIMTGNNCSPSGSMKHCIRIAISFNEEDVLVESVTKLCQEISAHIKAL